jgi:hypothetical protein
MIGDDVNWSELELRALRYENAAAVHGASCLFDSDTDRSIEDGYGCGGCACHLSAPCRHCLDHLPAEESVYIELALHVSGRKTSGRL